MIRATLLIGLVAILAASPAPVQAEHPDRVEHADELAVRQNAASMTMVINAREESPSLLQEASLDASATCCGGGGGYGNLTVEAECCGSGGGYSHLNTGPPLDRSQRMMVGFAALFALLASTVIIHFRNTRSGLWTS